MPRNQAQGEHCIAARRAPASVPAGSQPTSSLASPICQWSRLSFRPAPPVGMANIRRPLSLGHTRAGSCHCLASLSPACMLASHDSPASDFDHATLQTGHMTRSDLMGATLSSSSLSLHTASLPTAACSLCTGFSGAAVAEGAGGRLPKSTP